MDISSVEFELQIERIHYLIRKNNDLVTWNDHVRDPDNLKQLRQIDITIKNDNKLTVIECRIHKKKQDVKWIEELLGRKISLKADAIIAVSASGFTEGAIIKANKYGIFLRDFNKLREKEILEWGNQTTISITLFKYENVYIKHVFEKKYFNIVDIDDIENSLISNFSKYYLLFESVSKAINNENLEKKRFQLKFIVNDFKINNHFVKEIIFEADISKLYMPFDAFYVVSYGDPITKNLKRSLFIEKSFNGNFEIIQYDDIASLTIDFSSFNVPENCFIDKINTIFSKSISVDNVIFMGLDKRGVALTDFTFGIDFD